MMLEKVTLPQVPRDATAEEEGLGDFPKGARILPFDEMRDAARDYPGVPTIAKLANRIDPEGRIRPVDVFESLCRMDDAEREDMLAILHQRTRISLAVYVALREFIRSQGVGSGYRFADAARAIGRGEISLREFVRDTLGCTPSALGFPEREKKANGRSRAPRTEEDPGAIMRQAYVKAIRELADMRERIDASTIAGRLRINDVYDVTPETVLLFLAQPKNRDLIERVLRKEI